MAYEGRRFHRVVVTGVGAVTPLGNDAETYWRGLCEGRSGIGPITLFDASLLPVKIAGEVKGFDPLEHMDRRTARRTARFAQFGVAAAREALQNAGLSITETNRDDVGVVLATAGGLFETGRQEQLLRERGSDRIDPLFVTKMAAHMASARIGRELGLRGPNTTVNSACASGLDAVGQALQLLRVGHAGAILAGGSEAIISPVAVASMAVIGALSHSDRPPEKVSRPFDLGRDGFVLGEGAGFLVMETEEHALQRGARILAEVRGAGWSFDATDDTAPDPEGQALAMQRALRDAELDPGEVDVIKAHGTSTPLNDRAETAAIKQVFGDHAGRLAITAPKSMIGHLACAAGAVEAVACILMLRDQVVPPTINYETPDPECDLDYVPNRVRRVPISAVLADAFGLGGQNCSVVFTRYRT